MDLFPALKNIDELDQKNIDYIIENAHKKNDELYPKGIQEKTLQIILEELLVLQEASERGRRIVLVLCDPLSCCYWCESE